MKDEGKSSRRMFYLEPAAADLGCVGAVSTNHHLNLEWLANHGRYHLKIQPQTQTHNA